MRTEADVYRYRETLTYYREMSKMTIANVQQGSDERRKAIKVFLQCDGAIQILNWVLEL